jgi:hypothetical protein
MDVSGSGPFQNYVESVGSNDFIGKDGTTLWMSLLIKGSGDRANMLALGKSGGSTENVDIGHRSDELYWGVYRVGAAATASAVAGDPNTHMMIVRFNFGAANADTVDLWFDPDLNNFDLASPTGTTGTDDASFNFMSHIAYDSTGGPTIDEIRVGESRFDVGVVVPEPSTLTIWSLGLLGLIGWRRRRTK